MSLNPPGYSSSLARACHSGLQIGSSILNGSNHATLWAGTPTGSVDLHLPLPSGYDTSTAHGIDVDPHGVVTIVGEAHNISLNRSEAVLWRSGGNALLGDLTGNGLVNGADLATLLAARGTANSAADLYDNGVVDAADLAIMLAA